jgi:hypothetical protein
LGFLPSSDGKAFLISSFSKAKPVTGSITLARRKKHLGRVRRHGCPWWTSC